eukprot:94285-Pyramimonas_sp.AAC.1
MPCNQSGGAQRGDGPVRALPLRQWGAPKLTRKRWYTQVERSVATDPYARSLSADGERTHIADLAAADLAPEGWGSLAAEKPPLEAFTDASIYELHVRDF